MSLIIIQTIVQWHSKPRFDLWNVQLAKLLWIFRISTRNQQLLRSCRLISSGYKNRYLFNLLFYACVPVNVFLEVFCLNDFIFRIFYRFLDLGWFSFFLLSTQLIEEIFSVLFIHDSEVEFWCLFFLRFFLLLFLVICTCWVP